MKSIKYELLILDLGNDLILTENSTTKVWRHKPMYFSQAYNFLASKAKGSTLLVLNSDIILKPNCVSLMLDELKDGVAAVGCRLIYPPNSPTVGLIMHSGVYIYRNPYTNSLDFLDRGMHQKDNKIFHINKDVPIVTGACMLVKSDDFFTVGGFDENYKNGREDIALCLALWHKGKRIRYCGTAFSTHLQNGTGGTDGKKITSFEYDNENLSLLKKQLSKWEETISRLLLFTSTI